jgi:hypothetical protein
LRPGRARLDVGVSAVTGWALADLDRLSATQMVGYALACLEHEASRLIEAMQLALLPIESCAGGREIGNRLCDSLRSALDLAPIADDAERLTFDERANIAAGVAQIESELAREHAWYADELRRVRPRARGECASQRWLGDKQLLADIRRFLGREEPQQ